MPFLAELSTEPTSAVALEQVCSQAQACLSGRCDLACVFFSVHHASAARQIAQTLSDRLKPKVLLGCIAEAVIGNDREIENQPALGLWLARWTHPVRLTAFHLTLERTADGPALLGWPDELGASEYESESSNQQSAVLLLGDPFTFPADLFLERLNEQAAGIPVLGGMASGISSPGRCRLILGNAVQDQGAVGVLLEGDLGLRCIVSQGCRPIGRPLVITRAENNVIFELGGRTPYEYLQELWNTLSPRDQELFRRGLHIGRVVNEYQSDFQRGDFLIRNVLGLERHSGALIITDQVRVGQTVQFQVRDAQSADEDLHALLQLGLSAGDRPPGGGLVFSCNGRGTRLFDQPDHDARVIRQESGPIPLAGFFAMGELGPVGRQNFIHGFTASVALFSE
jgi:small ligand-binding sensory domain FIST